MKRLIIAVAIVGLMALPAFAAVQNVKVSGSIDSTWLLRDNFNLGLDSALVSEGMGERLPWSQNLLITQAILRVDADLTDNVSTVLQLLNEREWGDEAEAEDHTEVAVNLAYVVMRELLYSPLTVTIGRQNLRYGAGFIIGDPDTNNLADERLGVVAADLSKRKAFDAVKAVLDYNPLTIDLFAAKIDANAVAHNGTMFDITKDDVDLYGIVANWSLGDKYKSSIEPYYFARINDAQAGTLNKADTLYVPGFRVVSNPIEGLNTQAEIAWQYGNLADVVSDAGVTNGVEDNWQREAMGVQLIGSYALPGEKVKKYSPVVSGSYTFVSGDQNPNRIRPVTPWDYASEEKYTAWDPLFEDQNTGRIFNALFDNSNCHVYATALSMVPFEDITAKLSWTGIWLAKEMDEAYVDVETGDRDLILRSPDGTVSIVRTDLDETHVGNELDLDLAYDYTEDVKFGLSAGWFMPGKLFNNDNDDMATQVLSSVAVAF